MQTMPASRPLGAVLPIGSSGLTIPRIAYGGVSPWRYPHKDPVPHNWALVSAVTTAFGEVGYRHYQSDQVS